jgi:hypothetical protein
VLGQLGLAPADRELIATAYAHSRDRRWALLGPMCASALGTTLEVARRVGLDSCESTAMNHAYAHDRGLPPAWARASTGQGCTGSARVQRT